MNVFDFDGTIFRGDSTAVFTHMCAVRCPAVTLHILRTLPKYSRMPITQWKQELFGYLRYVPEPEKLVSAIADSMDRRVYGWYREIAAPDDVVISASPLFIVQPLCEKLGIKNVCASNVDIHTGIYAGVNCSKDEKVRVFRERFGDAEIDAFYSDSLKDSPMASIARRAYLVKHGRISPWPDIREG